MAPLIGLAAMICVGIAVDFSGQTIAEQSLRDQAAHCAREGAARMTLGAATVEVAINTAHQCLSTLGLTGVVTLSDNSLSIELAGAYQTKLLSIVAIEQLPVRGTAKVTVLPGR